MAACFCGILQDHKFTARIESDGDDGSIPSLRSPQNPSPTGKECVGGRAGGYPCRNTALLSFIPKNRFNVRQNADEDANDIWGWSWVDSGIVREFALIGLRDGVGMVEITDPVNPIVLGRLKSAVGTSMWRDIKVYQGYAFVVSETAGHGMQVFDLKRLLSASTTTFTNFEADTTFRKFRAHNLVINEDTGYAYIAGGRNNNGYICDGGLFMIDIANPLDPQNIGCANDGSYTHDAQCVVYNGPHTPYVGKEICFLCNTDHVGIVDVSDKENPVMLAEKAYRDAQYTHQGWLSPDHSYFVFGDELDETRDGIDTTLLIMNVEDLNNPGEPGRYVAEGRKAVDHNLYIRNFSTQAGSTDIVYFANYRAGLRVMKVNDYADPCTSTPRFEEIAYFDTYLEDDDSGFNGAWSVFPYFESGTVIVSSMGEGLFIVRPDISDHLPPTETPNPSDPSSLGSTPSPSAAPTCSPTMTPSSAPSSAPSSVPSVGPTAQPSAPPSESPSSEPSWMPSPAPSQLPSTTPTVGPDVDPIALQEDSNGSSASSTLPGLVVLLVNLLVYAY
eukprot:CAMPEP_0117082216 /NCGR_PEP_ID=MMETSP0472-20121206/57907_1 /TAXON_ID=693140 ORGANISM="Tiarina fusus, Strain LIS" /NCGR_SAMPLE_ID=MMETSP0472 /ASSEMBLY_ACC=CAM_ASM_000603 /LENGTH=557 /DNA_ID=CAMNT_0004810385 /DNA_START=256 /DNA_END=1929 /DNA_ORIENTATION=+